MAESYGLTLDPWQAQVIYDWCGRDRLGRFSSRVFGLSVPRQNGKNAILEAFELKMMTIDGIRFLHTAHEVKTAQVHFRRMKYFFGEKANDPNARYPELNDLVRTVRNTNGQEGIFLHNGGSIEFAARSRGSGRGYSIDILVLDEAQELSDDHMEALTPTLSASPDPILILTGTPPLTFDLGEVFRRTREAALTHTGKATCWHEWSVETIGNVADKKRWYETNPALGYRITEEYINDTEITVLSAEGFARERLGWWAERTAGESAINYEQWLMCSTEMVAPGTFSYGVKFSPDGRTVTLAGALKPMAKISDKIHVEVIKHESTSKGMGWLISWLKGVADTAASIVIDGRSGADPLKDALIEAKVPENIIIRTGTKDVINASVMFEEAIRSNELTHFNQEALNMSVKFSTKRPIGKDGGFGFASMAEEVSISLVEAASLAHFGAKKTKRRPGRKATLL